MSVRLVSRDATHLTIELKIPLKSNSFLESEETIQTVLNEAGNLATGEALQQFDTDGSALEHGGETWTSKGLSPKRYQTPYGVVSVSRHLYQRSSGGETFCPLEIDGRILHTATPRFAQQISHKYAEMSSPRLVEDLRANHGRTVTRSLVQTLAEAVGAIAQLKEEDWHYQMPKVPEPVTSVSLGLDGTCMLFCEGGYRQAMVGTISLYDSSGERQHTTYVAASPEHGRTTFLSRMTREIEQVKRLYPEAHYQGLADGAPENWTFLDQHTDSQVVDFYHVSEYLNRASKAKHPKNSADQAVWMQDQCHRLKHDLGAAETLLAELEAIPLRGRSPGVQDDLTAAITYFRNHGHQMAYAEARAQQLPIGSGVTEAACKVIVKARLCAAGMKWLDQGAAVVLSLRTLTHSKGRWQQFWSKINQYGFNSIE